MQDRGDSLPGAPSLHISIGVLIWCLVLSACAAAGPSPAAPTVTADPSVVALLELERPVLTTVKQAMTDLAAGDAAAAADRVETLGRLGRTILDWLDAHPDFVRANTAATGCLRATMTDLGEQAESFAPLLRQGDASPDQLNKLRVDLGEVANCIQSGD